MLSKIKPRFDLWVTPIYYASLLAEVNISSHLYNTERVTESFALSVYSSLVGNHMKDRRPVSVTGFLIMSKENTRVFRRGMSSTIHSTDNRL